MNLTYPYSYHAIKANVVFHIEMIAPSQLQPPILSATFFHPVFRYMNIENVAAVELYGMLMNDVRAVCIQKMEPGVEDSSINLEMLRLAYLLANLDKDWNEYIAPR